jgi:hypothetical protein
MSFRKIIKLKKLSVNYEVIRRKREIKANLKQNEQY